MKKIAQKIILFPLILTFCQFCFANIFNFEKRNIHQIDIQEIMKNIYKKKDSEYSKTNTPNQVIIEGNPQVILTMRAPTEYENIQGKNRYEVIIDIDEIVNGKPKEYDQCKKNVDVFTFANDIQQGQYTLVGMSLQGSTCTFEN